ncbi:MAG: hypothetical protein KKG40_05360, partial [Gammaproteobacteria bacterium]|nr:hypothetical protein [Gammaproteobacteria bacterium]
IRRDNGFFLHAYSSIGASVRLGDYGHGRNRPGGGFAGTDDALGSHPGEWGMTERTGGRSIFIFQAAIFLSARGCSSKRLPLQP